MVYMYNVPRAIFFFFGGNTAMANVAPTVSG